MWRVGAPEAIPAAPCTRTRTGQSHGHGRWFALNRCVLYDSALICATQLLTHGATANSFARATLRFRFGLRVGLLRGQARSCFPQEEPMASRRPPNTTSTPTPNPLATSTVPEAAPPPPAVKAKAPAKPRAPRAKKPAAAAGSITATATIEISEDVRRGMIAQAAYLRAERRGFTGGHDKEREDWIAAEAEVDALLKATHGSSAQ